MKTRIIKFLACAFFPAHLLVLMSSTNAASGPSGFSADVDAQLLHDDNVRRTIDRFAQSDDSLVISPALSSVWLVGKHQFDLGYNGSYGFYRDDTDLDFDDHNVAAHALLDHSSRLRSEFLLGYQLGHDAPGSTDSFSRPFGENSKWRNWNTMGKIYYGRDQSKGQIVAELNYRQLRYSNNNQEFRDYNSPELKGTFFYRVSTRSRLLLEAVVADYDYQNTSVTGADQSSKEYGLLTGITWTATAKTAGIFKIGYRKKQYDSNDFKDTSGLALYLDGIWNPNTYTTITFGALQEDRESARRGFPGYVSRAVYTSATHGITPATSLLLDLKYTLDNYEKQANNDQKRWYASLGVKYNLMRRVDIGAEYRYEERSADNRLLDFASNVILISASTTFD